jgi:WD repeat-containing protein 81
MLFFYFPGSIRCGTVSPDGHWLALGFASGMVSVLETRTGMLLVSHKAHESEILQVRETAYG